MKEPEDRISLDQEIANKMRHENSEQFVTLVRMHLSFELDLNTDDNDSTQSEKNKHKKWKGFHKKAKCTSNKSVSPEMAKPALTKQNIQDVKQLIQYLLKGNNIEQEGIFRKTGSVARQNELKASLVQGVSIDLNNGDYTAHDCASVLKSILADLPEPLLTEMYYPAYCQVSDFCNSKDSAAVKEDRLLHSIQLLFLLLPKENRILLKHIIEMLHKTIQYESTNKMSAENLATLFTPHLICPRKLAPEALHTTAAEMSSIIGFMIKKGSKLFYIPPKLATDIRAYFLEQKRRKTMSPEHILNESITSDSTANTVYTFVDREKTAEAHVMNSTDTALAQLYAHIQSLPESSKKKKLIKQFNKENGHGTPLQMLMMKDKNNSNKAGKSLRHIFHKSIMSRTPKRSQTPLSFHESIMTPRSRKPVMFFGGANTGGCDQQQLAFTNQSSFSSLREEDEDEFLVVPPASLTENEKNLMNSHIYRSKSENDLKKMLNDTGLPPCPPMPVSTSTVTSQSTNVNIVQDEDSSSLTSTFREYLLSRSVMTESPADLSFSSQPDDFDSETDIQDLSESEMSESLLNCMNGNMPSTVEENGSASLRKRHAHETNLDDKQISKKMVLQRSSE